MTNNFGVFCSLKCNKENTTLHKLCKIKITSIPYGNKCINFYRATKMNFPVNRLQFIWQLLGFQINSSMLTQSANSMRSFCPQSPIIFLTQTRLFYLRVFGWTVQKQSLTLEQCLRWVVPQIPQMTPCLSKSESFSLKAGSGAM